MLSVSPAAIRYFRFDLVRLRTTARRATNWLLASLCLITLTCSSAIATAQMPRDRGDNAYVDALEKQQLFDVIAWYSESRYLDSRLSPARRSTFAAHWLRAKTLAALNSSDDPQGSAWLEVDALAKRLTAETQLFARHQLVDFQAAVIGMARARLIRLQLKNAAQPELREQGLAAVRQSVDQLKQLQRDLVSAGAGAAPRVTDDPDDNFSRPQFQALGNDVDFQLLACLEVRADLYPATDKASRLDTWKQVLEQSRDLQPRLPMESPLWWQAQALALQAARQLSDWSEWKVRWDSAVLAKAPPEALGDMAAAQIMRDLDQDDLKTAAGNGRQFLGLIQLRSPDSIEGLEQLTDLTKATAWPSLDIARARLFLAEALASQPDSANQAERNILQFSDIISARHGRFWATELTSALLAGGASGPSTGSVSLVLLLDKIKAGQWDEVQQLAGQGIQFAIQNRQGEQALELAKLVAASGQANAQRWMVQDIELAALAFPEHPNAAAIHRYACILANRIPLEKFPRRSDVWVRHLEHWPEQSTADSVRVQLLAPHYIHQKQWDKALVVLNGVPATSTLFSVAVELMTACFSDAILELYAQSDGATNADQLATQWVQTWTKRLQDPEDQLWINRWNLAEKKLAVLLIQAQQEREKPDVLWTEELLKRIETRPPELDPAGVSRKRVVEARMWFLKAPATFSSDFVNRPAEEFQQGDLLWLAQTTGREIPVPGLSMENLTTNQRGRANAACQVFLQVFSMLDRSKLPETTQAWLSLMEVRCLVQLDRFEQAKQLAEAYAKRHPNSLGFQQLWGYCLAGSNDPTDAKEAEKHWRSLAFKTLEDSDEWFEAKYYLAEALRRQGKNEDAFKVLGFLKLTHAAAWEASEHRDSLTRLYQSLAPK